MDNNDEGESEFFEALNRDLSNIYKHHDALDNEFLRLTNEPSQLVPEEGDIVVVAAGLLNMGHPWIRLEATVLLCGDTSYKVRFTNREDYKTKKPQEMWVHQNLITDVIRKTKN